MARKQHHSRRNGKPSVLPENWAEPYTLNELAVDGKKVSEISDWLSRNRNRCGILLLTGPTGCGKTATVKCVARSLNFELREWVTPLDRNFEDGAGTGVYQNQTEKFEDFLYSCSRYSDLFVNSSSTASLLVVEDYPNIFLLKSEIFFDVLERYKKTARAPIVFICSNVADEGLDIERDLFPDQVRSKLQISRISLNAVTRTRMLQALKRMGAYLQSLTPGYRVPSLDTIAEICDSANGDVRYAMLTLQMKPQEDVVSMFEMAGKKGTGPRKKNAQKLTQEEEMIATCGKDDRVGVLHGVGRVLFPKWLNEGERALLNSKRKRKDDSKTKNLNATVPRVEWYHNPNTIVDSYLSSDSLIVLLVQENYLKTFTSIESVAAAAQCLSEADVLRNSVGVDASHEISFNLAVRGVMAHNLVPNRIFSPVRGSRCRELSDTQKKVLSLTQTLFPMYPVNLTILMTEIIPYMAHSCGNSLSNDQQKFVSLVASMEPLAKISDLFTTFREPYSEQKSEKATYVVNQKFLPVNEQDDELHISEDESDQEMDEGAENLTLLAAALDEDADEDEGAQNLSLLEAAIIKEEQREEIDYQALLNDSDDDDILLSQI